MTVKAIDNDASFASWKVGLQKFAIDKYTAGRFVKNLKMVCAEIHGKGGEDEFNLRVSKDPGIQKLGADGALTVDFAKVKSPEVKMAIIRTLGMQSIALPEARVANHLQKRPFAGSSSFKLHTLQFAVECAMMF